MKIDKRTRKRLLAHCVELHEDDGLDPRFDDKRDQKRDKQSYKTQQLCKQIEETLALVIGGEIADKRFDSIHIDRVIPAPDAAQLCVQLRADRLLTKPEILAAEQLIGMLEGAIRSEIAKAITRKRTPRLKFVILNDARTGGGNGD